MGCMGHVKLAPYRLIVLGVVSAVFAVVVVSAVTGAGASASLRTTPNRPVVHAGVKPVLSGLILMPNQAAYLHGLPFPTVDPGVLGPDGPAFVGTAVDVGWSQLEPEEGRYDWAPLDASLAAVSAYNRAHPSSTLGVKLRVVGGYDAPVWATRTGGPPLTIDDRTHGADPGTLGRWWTTPYQAAWSTFEHALANRYDTDPLIRMVQVTSCATTTEEPFITPGRPADRALMTADGWTTAGEEACLTGAFAAYSGWHHTAIDYPVNTLDVGPDGQHAADTTFSAQIATECATSSTRGGPECIIDNHGLRDTSASSAGSAWLFALMDQLWQQHPATTGVALQAFSPTDGEDCAAMVVAVTHHASSVELWAPSPVPSGFQGFRSVPMASLTAWNRALRTGLPPAC
jgi:hypothetical protein